MVMTGVLKDAVGSKGQPRPETSRATGQTFSQQVKLSLHLAAVTAIVRTAPSHH